MRKAIYTVSVAVACICAYEGAIHWTIKARADSPIAVLPFTLVWVSFDSAGQMVEERTMARRGDGSDVQVSATKGGVMRRIDLTDGAAMTLFDSMQLKMSGWLGKGQVAARKSRLTNPPANCLWPGDKLVDLESIGGVSVDVVESTRGSYRMREDRAPEFACKSLAAIGEDRQPDGSYRTRFEARFVSLARGEPDSRLFERGNAYKERRPSQILAEALQRAGVTPDKCPVCFSDTGTAAMDARYQKGQR
jgi:hypothetical protein